MDKLAFAHAVRDALIHLYDHVYLQDRSLAELLADDAEVEIRGRSLHRVLLEAIEALRPDNDVPPRSAAWRPYRVLFLRYVEALDSGQIAEQLAISPRQVRREHSRGVDMVVDLLWRRHLEIAGRQAPGPQPTRLDTGQPLLDAAVAKLGMGGPDSVVSASETLAGALAMVGRLAEERRIRFRTALQDNLPPITVDRVVLRQVLLSVLMEILDGRIAGPVDVSAAELGNEIEVTFHCAAGVEWDRVRSAESDHLSVARHLLEMQGGRLDVTGGVGPLFRLWLPARRAVTVLVVDDDPDMVRLFQRYLGGGTYRVLTATSGPEALSTASEKQPRAITLDVMMPNQDGWEVLQLLKNHPQTGHIPVIVCSVLRESDLAASLGAAGFLAKPVTQLALLAALAQCGLAPVAAEHPGLPADSA